MFYSLFIIGNNGGMIYAKHFTKDVQLNQNDCLQISSSLFTINDLTSLAIHPDNIKDKKYGMDHLITHKLQSVNTDKFTLHFFNSLTNLKIILLTHPQADNIQFKMNKIYKLYSNFVRNNWRYMVNQQVRSTDQIITLSRRDFKIV